MPFRKFNSRRQKTKSFHYFRGTKGEIETASTKKLGRIFQKNGIRFANEIQERQSLESFRRQVLVALERMEQYKIGSKTFSFSTPNGIILFEFARKKGGFFIHQLPVTHGVKGFPSPFQKLKEILKEGFRTRTNQNNVIMYGYRAKSSFWADAEPEYYGNKEKITWGDRYNIEIMAPLKSIGQGEGIVEKAEPNQIIKVNIILPETADSLTIKRKKEFYHREIQKKSGVFVNFVIERKL